MGFFEEHFDAEMGAILAIGSAFWGLVRHNDVRDKEHLKECLKRIEDDMEDLSADVKRISSHMVSIDTINKLDDDIDALQRELNLTREKMVSNERVKELDTEFEGLRSIIQKTREQMLQVANKGDSDAARVTETLKRLEKTVDAKADRSTCPMMHSAALKLSKRDE